MGKTPMRRALAALLATVAVAGCATAGDPRDPWEGYNRAMYSFNEGVDKAVFKPLAIGYDEVAPLPVKAAVGNFFGNIEDLWTGLNNLLQGKGGDGAADIGRVLINTTVGILGVFDVATEMGMEKRDEDFGQTLAVWGVSDGPYFVVPFFGPRTLRDAVALPADLYGNSWVQPADIAARNTTTGLKMVHARASLLGADRAATQGSLDKYAYIRDFYLQQRRYEIYDGQPPRERFDDARAPAMERPAIYATQADGVAEGAMRLELAGLTEPRH
ncbi:MlaA family lipoprotein [Denitromonas iodatirespirans]|nr:VacJ family lipoprotein [Denitromonas iodatirespirans]